MTRRSIFDHEQIIGRSKRVGGLERDPFLNLTAVPVGATVKRAYLYTIAISGRVMTSIVFENQSLPIQQIGYSAGTRSSKARRVYRNDVTNMVPGNGSYSISLAAGGWQRGAALVVIYEDPNIVGEFQIELHDGAHSGREADGAGDSPWVNPTTFTGFVVDGSSPPEAEVGYIIYNGGLGYTDWRFFEGVKISSNDAATTGCELNVYDVSSFFAGGETSASANCGEGSAAITCMANLFRVRVGPAVIDTSPPVVTINSPGDGAVVTQSPVTVAAAVRDASGTTVTSVPPLTWHPGVIPGPSEEAGTWAALPLVEGANSVNVTVTDDHGWSSTTGATFYLDTHYPEVQFLAPADGSVIGSTQVVLNIAARDLTEMRLAVFRDPLPDPIAEVAQPGDPIHWETLWQSVNLTVELVEGTNLLVVQVTDAAGHIASASLDLTVDTQPPGVSVQSPMAGAVFGETPIPFVIHVADLTTTTVGFGGNVASAEAPEASVTGDVSAGLVEGGNVVVITAVDAAGNVTTTSHPVTLDLSVPIVTIDEPQPGAIFGPNEFPVPVIVTVDDITEVTVVSDPQGLSGTVQPGGPALSGFVDLVAEGYNTLRVTATDAGGHAASQEVTVIRDTTPPTLTLESPGDGDAVHGVIDFHASANDAVPGSGVSHVEFDIDGIPLVVDAEAPFGTELDTEAWSEGWHQLGVTAWDQTGNSSTTAAVVLVDNSPPVAALTLPAPGAWVSGDCIYEVMASDAVSGVTWLSVRVAGVPPADDPLQDEVDPPQPSLTRSGVEPTTRWADGPLTFTAVVRDAAGLETAATAVTVMVDNQAPASALVAPSAGSRVSGVIAIIADAQDPNLASLEILVDGTVVASSMGGPLQTTYDTLGRLDGAMLVEVIATDLAGNTSVDSAGVVVDNVSMELAPSTLNLKSKGSTVTVKLEGHNLALLMPTEDHHLELVVPGASPVPSVSGFAGDDVLGDEDVDGIPDLTVKFDRGALVDAVRAGITAGAIEDPKQVPTTLFARSLPTDEPAAVGMVTIRVKG